MSDYPYEFGKAPCGNLESICTAGKNSFCWLNCRDSDKRRKSSYSKTIKGEFGHATELVLEPPNLDTRILLTSIHGSYNVDGTNGLLQVLVGNKLEAIWGARTMGNHLTIVFYYPIVGVKGEKMVLQLVNKAGVQGRLSATWLIEE